MAKWTVVDKEGRSVVVDALYARVESGGVLAAMGNVHGFHGAVHTWAPGEWRTFAPGGEDAHAIVMRQAGERRCRVASLELELRNLPTGALTIMDLRSWRAMAEELMMLRSEMIALEGAARELKRGAV